MYRAWQLQGRFSEWWFTRDLPDKSVFINPDAPYDEDMNPYCLDELENDIEKK